MQAAALSIFEESTQSSAMAPLRLQVALIRIKAKAEIRKAYFIRNEVLQRNAALGLRVVLYAILSGLLWQTT
jgi:hypothetical protein